MGTQRLFIIAPSLARLIRKERRGERVIEGYFPDRPHRSTYVQIEETRSSLILEAEGDRAPEEQAGLPPAHAQALLAVSHGQVEYLRTNLSVGSREIQALDFVRPAALNLVAVTSAHEGEQDFRPLPWFGSEVSADPAYGRRRLALEGFPNGPEVELTDAALNSLLDLLEDRVTTGPLPQQVELDRPAPGISPPTDIPVSDAASEAQEEIDDLGIEDDVIRELARTLQPRRGR